MTREWVFKYIMLNWRAKRYTEAETELIELLSTSREDGYLSVHYDCHYYLGKLLRERNRKEESQKWFKEFLKLSDPKDEFSIEYQKEHKRIIREASRVLGYTQSWFGRLISGFKNS